jgi:hypothetical protein
MSTPAANVLSSNAGDPSSATPTPAGSESPAGGNSQPAANEGFWKDWTAPEQKETREWIANKKYADPFILAKTAQGLEKEAAQLRTAVGVKAYPAEKVNPDGSKTPPDPNAVTAWKTAMGVPDSPDKYGITPPKDNPEFANALTKGMMDVGVPLAMAPKLVQMYEEAFAATEKLINAKQDTQSQTDLKQLEMEWGSNYKERVALAQRGKDWLSKEVGGLSDQQLRGLEATLGTAKFMATMWKFGAGNKEPGFASGASPTMEGGASAAKAEYDQIMADRSAGKIKDYTWNSKEGIARRDALVERIANGNAH